MADTTEYAPQPGVITVAATPIGNVGDASLRLRQGLEQADVVAAEDTRRLLNLAARLGIRVAGSVVAMHEHNESQRAEQLIEAARDGKSVVIVSDAGMPTVSDPGFRLVQAAVAAGVPVTVAPGPSAVLTALTLSGLPTDRFCFEGFVPRKAGEQARYFAQVAHDPRTLIFFESPRRTAVTLTAMADAFGGQRPAALCRELTKTYEEVRRASLAELAEQTRSTEVLGEVVIVVGGYEAPAADAGDAAAQALALSEAQGLRLKAAAAQVAEQLGLRTNEVYRAALAAQQHDDAL